MILHALDLTDRTEYRSHTAALLRLLRRSKRDPSAPVLIAVAHEDDRLHLALWTLGAFKRTALPGAVWINADNDWPVVRHPASLQYFTLDPATPLAAPQPFPYPRYSHTTSEGRLLTVQ